MDFNFDKTSDNLTSFNMSWDRKAKLITETTILNIMDLFHKKGTNKSLKKSIIKEKAIIK